MAGVYIHIPYCIGKCRYCAFNSRPLAKAEDLGRYAGALSIELENNLKSLAGVRPDTIYFGGGTPTLASAEANIELLKKILDAVGTGGDSMEITIEANPDTLDAVKLSTLRKGGFNRISIGAQSFDEKALAYLGRTHSPEQTFQAAAWAREAGFENLGLDLIVGLPQPFDRCMEADLNRALDLSPQHLSVYLLTMEPPSILEKQARTGEVKPLDEDAQADAFMRSHAVLASAGYEHYEVSNFARPGFRSRHNSGYWTGEKYIGLGAGAHSYADTEQGPARWGNLADSDAYIAAIESGANPREFTEIITPEMALREKLMLGLRTAEGVNCSRFGEYSQGLFGYLDSLAQDGFYTRNGSRFRPTPAGLLIADGVAADAPLP